MKDRQKQIEAQIDNALNYTGDPYIGFRDELKKSYEEYVEGDDEKIKQPILEFISECSLIKSFMDELSSELIQIESRLIGRHIEKTQMID